MPAVSKKQQKFMQAVANNSDFANKVGVNQSIGREFTKEKSMKTKKMNMGGMADKRGRAMTRYAGDPRLMADAGGRAMMKKGGKVKKMRKGGNTSRMNELEELGRVDAEKGYTAKGKRNLRDEKKRVVREIENKKAGGKVKGYKAGGMMADKEGRALAKNKRGMSSAKMADARGRAMGKAAKMKAGGMKRQGANDRLDESLGMRRGKEATKSQSMKSRRDESRGMKAGGATMKAKGKKMAYGGKVKKMKAGGMVKGRGNASKRADGIAQKGHTRGRIR